jgi:hypothetical protein
LQVRLLISNGNDARGPWIEGGDWQFVEDSQPAVSFASVAFSSPNASTRRFMPSV